MKLPLLEYWEWLNLPVIIYQNVDESTPNHFLLFDHQIHFHEFAEVSFWRSLHMGWAYRGEFSRCQTFWSCGDSRSMQCFEGCSLDNGTRLQIEIQGHVPELWCCHVDISVACDHFDMVRANPPQLDSASAVSCCSCIYYWMPGQKIGKAGFIILFLLWDFGVYELLVLFVWDSVWGNPYSGRKACYL